MENYCHIASDVVFGKNVSVSPMVNLYGCLIGDETKIGPFVEIQLPGGSEGGCHAEAPKERRRAM